MPDPLEVERYRREAQEKFHLDWVSSIACARDEGREEGLAKGEPLGRIHLCQRLLGVPLTPWQELLALPLAELQAKAEVAEKQLGIGGF